MNYYRITGYYKEDDVCFIVDSNGKFEKLWEFSSYLIKKDVDIIEVGRLENMIDINIEPAKEDNESIFLRANTDGKPEYTEQIIDGKNYKAIKVADKIYIPDKGAILWI